MPYLILFMSAALLLAIALHLRNQLRQTAHIRQSLREARTNKTLKGVHYLRTGRS